MSGRRQALADLAARLRGAPVGAGALASLDWMAVLELANDQLLTPALWAALAASGQAPSLPQEARDYLATLYRLNGERNRALQRQAIELVGALNEQGITPMLLKGGLALFDGLYADPAMRMMRDLDILVPVGARDDTIAVLHRLDYRIARAFGAGHHAVGEFARPNDPGSVDLHTELVDQSYVLPASEIWTRAEVTQACGIRYRTPCATDRVMHNLLHAQVHYLANFYRGELELQQAHELVALARCFGPAVDWRFVEQRMVAHRLTTPLQSYLLTAHHLLGLKWPLAMPPTFAARLHYRRCVLQFVAPPLRWIGVPWGNLRSALAWHRMRALHGSAGGPLSWRCRHLLQCLRKNGIGASLQRLLRVD